MKRKKIGEDGAITENTVECRRWGRDRRKEQKAEEDNYEFNILFVFFYASTLVFYVSVCWVGKVKYERFYSGFYSCFHAALPSSLTERIS